MIELLYVGYYLVRNDYFGAKSTNSDVKSIIQYYLALVSSSLVL
jgi:hypothetical protein